MLFHTDQRDQFFPSKPIDIVLFPLHSDCVATCINYCVALSCFPSKVAPLLPEKRIVATWSDSGSVHVWDITKHALLIDTPGGAKGGSKAINEQPIYSFSGHQVSEGVCLCVCGCVWVCRCSKPYLTSLISWVLQAHR